MKSIASLSLDLDNKWSYLKTHGDSSWKSLPSYLDLVIPRIVNFLSARRLTISVFIVGQDAARPENEDALRTIADAGHEIANHSFHHEPWLASRPEPQIEAELARAEEAIERATGHAPVGFRGPGFSVSNAILRILARRGYLYDASILPTFLGPLARAYYFRRSALTKDEKRQRAALFGTFRDGLKPLKPSRSHVDGRTLVEIPVTTMPLLRLPIHISYVLYLSLFSRALAMRYFRAALSLCRLTRTEPSLLLHPLDFLGCDDMSDLSFFPAMNLPSERKLEIVAEALSLLASQFTVLTLREHALRHLGARSTLHAAVPSFKPPR